MQHITPHDLASHILRVVRVVISTVSQWGSDGEARNVKRFLCGNTLEGNHFECRNGYRTIILKCTLEKYGVQ
jgi:hypothetical protein